MISRKDRDRMIAAIVPALALGLGVFFASPIALAPTIVGLPPGHVVVPISGAVDLAAQANRTKSLQERVLLLERQIADQRQARAGAERMLEERGTELDQLRGEIEAVKEKLATETAENQRLRDIINARDNRGNRAPRPQGLLVPPGNSSSGSGGSGDAPVPKADPRGRVTVEQL
jgi:septal ring factor EnvC (AmiA/AmiB activator)